MEISIRKARQSDRLQILDLLRQVNNVHAEGRPDLFIRDKVKYSLQELSEIIDGQEMMIFVAVDDTDKVVGYCFCQRQDFAGSNNMQPIKTLYIDDLCVDSRHRGKHIGHRLYDYVKSFAKKEKYYNLTLNVWICNPSTIGFYQSLGMTPLKIGMETIL